MDLIISNKPPNRGSTPKPRGHAISVVGPHAVDVVLVRTADCICPHHVLVNRWAALDAIHRVLCLLGPSLLQSLRELGLQLQLSEIN